MSQIILLIYRVLTFIIVWPLCWALRNHPNFKDTLAQRLALKLPRVPQGDLIWFHGASLGEIKALSGLIGIVKARRPKTVICVSTMTAAGRKAATGIQNADLVLPQPFDVPWIIKRYIRHLAPKTLIIAETEIWPNMLMAAETAGVSVAMINARLSARALKRYLLVKPLFCRLLKNVRILAIAEEHADRFRALGANNLNVVGNVKFDAVQSLHTEHVEVLRRELSIGERPVFIAGSIREGEEQAIVEAVFETRKIIPNLFCIVAPRHHDRIKYVIDSAESRSMSWTLRSKPVLNPDILILDTVGELFDLYGLAHAAFVGGSLVKLGGQNILEPIVWGIPTIHGPHMDNFLWAMDVVGKHTITVINTAELTRELISILSHPENYMAKTQMAKAALESAKGATKRYADEVARMIPE